MWEYPGVVFTILNYAVLIGGSVIGSRGLVIVGVIWWIISLLYWVHHDMKAEDECLAQQVKRKSINNARDAGSVTRSKRSKWEYDLANYVRRQSGCFNVLTNDRSVIIASDGHTPLEIDIYIPNLRLGIEADGIRWHNREAYRRDQRNGTEYSEEMYKERYCARRGIKLIHVWDEDGETEVRRQIDDAIREQRNRLNTW